MLLPFLKNKQAGGIAGTIVKNRTPDEKPEEPSKDDPKAAITACARALINAIHARDDKGTADAIEDILSVLDGKDDDEQGPPAPEPHSYDAQKQD